MRKLTTEEFIEKAIRVHGSKYDYSKVRYVNNRIKVKIFCKKHNNFFYQSPSIHMVGSGCLICGYEKTANSKRRTRKEFIERAREIHGNRYGYNKVNYINEITKVIILCKIHGEFESAPHNHLYGKGCPECGRIESTNKRRKTNKQFIIEAKQIHGERYDYSKVKYRRSLDNIIIGCRKHNSYFRQTPSSHLLGHNCPKCVIEVFSKKLAKTKEEFINEAKEIHGDRYDYSEVNYVNSREKIIIYCPFHNSFEQLPGSHLQGIGCPHCRNKNEGKVKILLFDYFKDWTIIPNKKIWHTYKDYNRKRFCDFWLEKDNIKVIVEYDGTQHFRPVRFNGISPEKAEKLFKHTQLKDLLDHAYCLENNIILHRIRYNEDKEESIKRLLLLLTTA